MSLKESESTATADVLMLAAARRVELKMGWWWEGSRPDVPRCGAMATAWSTACCIRHGPCCLWIPVWNTICEGTTRKSYISTPCRLSPNCIGAGPR